MLQIRTKAFDHGIFQKNIRREKRFRRRFSVENPADVESLLLAEDSNSSIIAFDNRIAKVCANGDDLGQLTPSQRPFFLIQNLDREVNNGGFHQYFINSSVGFAMETADALKKIGARKTAGFLESAMDEFPDGFVPPDREARITTVQKIEDKANDKWDQLDQLFYRYDENLDELCMAFIRNPRLVKAIFKGTDRRRADLFYYDTSR